MSEQSPVEPDPLAVPQPFDSPIGLQSGPLGTHATYSSHPGMRRLLDGMSLHVVEWRHGGEILYVNQALCETFAQPRELLQGQNFYTRLFPGKFADQWDRARIALALGRPMNSFVTETRSTDERAKYFSWRLLPCMEASGQIHSILGLGLDVSSLALAEIMIERFAELLERTMKAEYP